MLNNLKEATDLLYKEFEELRIEYANEYERKYANNDIKPISMLFSKNTNIPKTDDDKPIIVGSYTKTNDTIYFCVDLYSYNIPKYKDLILKLNERMAYRSNHNVGDVSSIRSVFFPFLDRCDIKLISKIPSKQERKDILYDKWSAFFTYISAISDSINEAMKNQVPNTDNNPLIGILNTNEQVVDIWDKFYNSLLEYSEKNWKATFRTAPDKSQILLDFNIGIDKDDATIGSIFVDRQTDELGVICLYIAKMQNIDPKKSYFMSRHYNILPIKELIENFDKGFEKIIGDINHYFDRINLWKFFISTTKSKLEELSVQAKLTEDEISIICPLKRDIDMTTIAARIYLTSNEDCADCVECGIVKMDYDCQKQLKVLKKSMLTVFGTDFPTKEDFDKCITKLTDWVQEQKTKYENQKF